MKSSKKLYTITLGGWYQRTTLHLSEIYDFFLLGHTDLKLDQSTLKDFQKQLDFATVTREWGDLEYVEAQTTDGITVRYYEDGLYTLSLTSTDPQSSQKLLQAYLDNHFLPAVGYIFSLGAPTPKELAAIKTHHPVVISSIEKKLPQTASSLPALVPTEVYSQISTPQLSVFKTPQTIYLFQTPDFSHARELVEMQIFFREFKDQLHRYLNIHRDIWEKISSIKERGSIAGQEVEALRSELDNYQKTTNLIKSRLNQMGAYVHTRGSLSKKLSLDNQLSSLFQYKFETLSDTHSYVKDIWQMTQEYISTAIQVINEVQSHSTSNGINSLRLITTIGVLSGIFGYLSKDQFPTFTLIGLWYFFVLVVGTWVINQVVTYIYQRLRYQLKFASHNGIK